MSEKLELVHGSGNAFRDFGYLEAEAMQLKAKLAARVIGILAKQSLDAKAASVRTGIPAVDYSRILNARIDKLSIERLLKILATLGQDVDVSLTFAEGTGARRAMTA